MNRRHLDKQCSSIPCRRVTFPGLAAHNPKRYTWPPKNHIESRNDNRGREESMGTSKQGLSRRLNWRKLVMGVGLAGLVGGAFCFGRLVSPAEAVAKPPYGVHEKATEALPPPPSKTPPHLQYIHPPAAWN